MSDDLRLRLDQMTTAELLEVLRVHDLKEWRPEVFPLVESILRGRGVDVAGALAQPPGRNDLLGAADTAPESSPDFVKVADLPNPAALAMAKSLLEESGLRFFIKNEGTQGLFGLGAIGGYNLIIGPPVVMVEASRSEEARELLEPLLAANAPNPGEGEI